MNKAVYQRLLATYGKSPWQWVGLIMEMVGTLSVRVVAPIVMAQAIAHVAAGDTAAAQSSVLWFLACYAGGFTIQTISSLLIMYAGNNQYRIESRNYHRKLTTKDMRFYRDTQTGYVVSMFRQYLDTMIVFSRFLIQDLTPTVISITVPTVILCIIDWHVGVVAVVLILIQFFYMRWASGKAHEARLASHEAYRRMSGEVSDAITNITAYKASGREESAEKYVQRYAYDETDAYWKRHKTITLFDLPRAMLTSIGATVAFYVAAGTTMTGPEAVGMMVLVMTYMFQIVRNIGALPNMLIKHDDHVSKIFPTLAYLGDEYETVRDPSHPKRIPSGEARVEIDRISFAYQDGKDTHVSVFRDLSIDISPGEQVGIVGLSGAGKSTLASLVMRFDDVNEGAIRINGVDVRDTKQTWLRQSIAYVPQEPLLFHKTIRENIAYFADDVIEARIVAAAKAAHAHEFITKLPRGYDTLVGERGVKLSGGQKQRVAIARAILKDAPIILFDEATSALDSESEEIIQRALPEILGKRTAMIIAHRLSTVAGLDRIIVLEHGKIVEQGTHEELIVQNGRYARLWRKQTRDASVLL